MKIIGLSILKFDPASGMKQPVFLSHESDLSQFGFFERATAAQFIKFVSRTVLSKTPPGKRQSVLHEGNHVRAHLRSDGLGAVCVTDKEYPERVAFSILSKQLDDFFTKYAARIKQVTEDSSFEFEELKKAIVEYQDPSKADKLTKIQKDLNETIEVMHKTIENLLERDVKLNTLVEKSDDLSAQSKLFYKSAAQHNQCCTIS
eukprot:maker-scaffold_58-snap-gene-0.19-mRNA-1 protein AED:0.01 eAED:0.01 QI:154/1/1/1/1/1/2/1105/202